MSDNYRHYARKIAEHRKLQRVSSHPLGRQLDEFMNLVRWCERVWAIEDRIEKTI